MGSSPIISTTGKLGTTSISPCRIDPPLPLDHWLGRPWDSIRSARVEPGAERDPNQMRATTRPPRAALGEVGDHGGNVGELDGCDSPAVGTVQSAINWSISRCVSRVDQRHLRSRVAAERPPPRACGCARRSAGRARSVHRHGRTTRDGRRARAGHAHRRASPCTGSTITSTPRPSVPARMVFHHIDRGVVDRPARRAPRPPPPSRRRRPPRARRSPRPRTAARSRRRARPPRPCTTDGLTRLHRARAGAPRATRCARGS